MAAVPAVPVLLLFSMEKIAAEQARSVVSCGESACVRYGETYDSSSGDGGVGGGAELFSAVGYRPCGREPDVRVFDGAGGGTSQDRTWTVTPPRTIATTQWLLPSLPSAKNATAGGLTAAAAVPALMATPAAKTMAV